VPVSSLLPFNAKRNRNPKKAPKILRSLPTHFGSSEAARKARPNRIGSKPKKWQAPLRGSSAIRPAGYPLRRAFGPVPKNFGPSLATEPRRTREGGHHLSQMQCRILPDPCLSLILTEILGSHRNLASPGRSLRAWRRPGNSRAGSQQRAPTTSRSRLWIAAKTASGRAVCAPQLGVAIGIPLSGARWATPDGPLSRGRYNAGLGTVTSLRHALGH